MHCAYGPPKPFKGFHDSAATYRLKAGISTTEQLNHVAAVFMEYGKQIAKIACLIINGVSYKLNTKGFFLRNI